MPIWKTLPQRITPFKLFAGTTIVAFLALIGVFNLLIKIMYRTELGVLQGLADFIAATPDWSLFLGVLAATDFLVRRFVPMRWVSIAIGVVAAYLFIYNAPALLNRKVTAQVADYLATDMPYDVAHKGTLPPDAHIAVPRRDNDDNLAYPVAWCGFVCANTLTDRPSATVTVYPIDPRDDSLVTHQPDPNALFAETPTGARSFTTQAHNGSGCGYVLSEELAARFTPDRHYIARFEEDGFCIIPTTPTRPIDLAIVKEAGYATLGREIAAGLLDPIETNERVRMPDHRVLTVRRQSIYIATDQGPTLVARQSNAWPHVALTPLRITRAARLSYRPQIDLFIHRDVDSRSGLEDDLVSITILPQTLRN